MSFVPARLVDRRPAGGSLYRIVAEHEARASHRRPGQYAEVRAEGTTGYFVIASDVGEASWQFIVRAGGGAADALLAMPLGATFEMTAALGEGFPFEGSRGRRLLMVVNGTGIAAALPVVRLRIAEGDAARTTVLVGVRSRDEEPIPEELDRWERANVKVTVCFSQPGADTTAPRHAHGYVQDLARARGTTAEGRPDRVFVVGVPTLVEAMRALAPSLGLRPADVHTNY